MNDIFAVVLRTSNDDRRESPSQSTDAKSQPRVAADDDKAANGGKSDGPDVDTAVDLDFTALDYEAMDAAHSDNETDTKPIADKHANVNDDHKVRANSESSDSSVQGDGGCYFCSQFTY